MEVLTEVPVEEYLATSYEPDMEYVDGQLVERHVGEYSHSRLQTLIVIVLGNREVERRFRGAIFFMMLSKRAFCRGLSARSAQAICSIPRYGRPPSA